MPLQIVASDSISGQTLTFSATGLPPGLSISSSGLITGIPTTSGTYNPVITVTDQLGISGTATFTWFITPATGNTVTVTNPGAQTATQGTAITNLQMAATDSQVGQTFTWSATSLPTGLAISSSGLISGTPTAPGTFSVTVKAVDTTNAFGVASFTWVVSPSAGNTITVTNPGNQNNNVGSVVSLQITAIDSASGQTLTFTATGLPTGLSITAAGKISGTVGGTAGTTYNTVVTATDTTNATGSAAFTWTVPAGNVITVTNPGSQSNNVGAIINLQIVASDSNPAQTLSYSATGLPTGLSISSSTGLITGSPTTVQSTTTKVTVTDPTTATGSASFSWSISAAPAFVPFVGSTQPDQANAAGCYAAGLTQLQQDQQFISFAQRPSATAQEVLVTKKYWQTSGTWTDMKANSVQMYAQHGTRILAALHPDPALTTTDYNALVTMAATFRSLGHTSKTINFVFWQEGNQTSLTAAQYGAIHAFYGPALSTAAAMGSEGVAFPIVADLGSNRGNQASFAAAVINSINGSPNKAKIPFLGFAQDHYAGSFHGFAYQGSGTNANLDLVGSLANQYGFPFGVYEFGCSPTQVFSQFGGTAGISTFQDAENYCQIFLNHFYAYFNTRIINGLPNLDVVWYNGNCGATGNVGEQTSPMGLDPSVTTNPDFRIVGLPPTNYPIQTGTINSGSSNITLSTSTSVPIGTNVVITGTMPGGFVQYLPYVVVASGTNTIKVANIAPGSPTVSATSTVNSGMNVFLGNKGYRQLFDSLNGA